MCGAKQPKVTSVLTWVCVGILGLAAIIWMYSDKAPTTSHPWDGVDNVSNRIGKCRPKKLRQIPNIRRCEMRGIEVSRFATTVSANTVDFDFPYNGGSRV